MSRRVKKVATSASFSMNKVYHRVSTAKPSTLIVSIVAIAIAVFLFGGGLYDIITKPYSAVYYGGRFLFYYPQLSEQFIADSIVSMILYSLGIIGLITMYQSTKYAYKPRQATLMLVTGLVLFFMAYVVLEVTIQMKLSGG